MLILAIDTSGPVGSIALCRGDARSFKTLQRVLLEGGTYSARLMPGISEVLAANNVSKQDVDGFVAVSGPGSFTGLRVGLATVKGLCEVLQKPLAVMSMLEAMALTYGAPGETVTALLDAGRGEVYVGEYRVDDGAATLVREYILKLAELVADVSVLSGRVLTPHQSVAEFLQSARLIEVVLAVRADGVGRIGLRKLLTGDVVDAATVDVNYIRRSDAEIFSAPKH